MIFDSTNKFSSTQVVTTTAASTNAIDLGVSLRDVGNGETVPVYIRVDADFATLTSLQVVVQTDDAENFGSAVTVVSSAAIGVADLLEGYQFAIIQLPLGLVGRYIRLNYVVVGTAATTGSITAGVTAGNQQNG
jgi:hypothetical protein